LRALSVFFSVSFPHTLCHALSLSKNHLDFTVKVSHDPHPSNIVDLCVNAPGVG
jgi:hypothetical protein